jgi:hypothetical protein
MALTFKRPKSVTTVDTSLTLNGEITSDGDDYIVRIYASGITPDEFTVASCNASIADLEVTGSSGAFTNVRVGDVITGTAIDTDTTVAAVEDGVITLDKAPTADVTDDSLEITVTPPTLDATMFLIKITPRLLAGASQLDLFLTTGLLDGSKVEDATGTGSDQVTMNDVSSIRNLNTINIQLDKYFANARVSRAD